MVPACACVHARVSYVMLLSRQHAGGATDAFIHTLVQPWLSGFQPSYFTLSGDPLTRTRADPRQHKKKKFKRRRDYHSATQTDGIALGRSIWSGHHNQAPQHLSATGRSSIGTNLPCRAQEVNDRNRTNVSMLPLSATSHK